jgi:hypothetical protein
MNPIYRRERGFFYNNLELRYTIFFEMQYQQVTNNANSLFVLFEQLISNIFKTKILLKIKMLFTFQKEPHDDGGTKENQ